MSDVPPQNPQPGQQPQQPAGQQPPPQQPAGQQPPPQQPAGQDPAGQQPPPQQPAGQASDGLDPKVANLLSYLFTWLGGLIMYLTQKDREVRFHAAQAILFGIAWFGLMIVWTIVSIVLGLVSGTLATIFNLLGWVVGIGFIVVWIMLIVKGFGMQHWKLPVIGDMAEKWAAK